MQLLIFFFVSWTFVAVGNAQAPEPNSILLDDDVGPNLVADSDSDFPVAEDIKCDVSDTENVQIFGKIRRSTACPNPSTGQAATPNNDGKKEPPNLENLGNALQSVLVPIRAFAESPKLCPSKVFGLSVIPVCSKPGVTKMDHGGIPSGKLYVNLRNVFPVQGLMCRDDDAVLWCCRKVVPQKKLVITTEMAPEEVARLVAEQKFDAFICYLQSLAENGLPTWRNNFADPMKP